MFMQIFATLLIGGFVTLALIGHVALLQAFFFSLRTRRRTLQLLQIPQDAAELPRLAIPEPALRTA